MARRQIRRRGRHLLVRWHANAINNLSSRPLLKGLRHRDDAPIAMHRDHAAGQQYDSYDLGGLPRGKRYVVRLRLHGQAYTLITP